MSRPVAVVRTGTANLASVLAAFRRLGAEPLVVDDPDAVARADRLVLPGVGTFAAARAALDARALVGPLRERLRAGRPTLAICLGFQLLFEASEESPGAEGLGLLPGVVRRFPAGARTPHLGWNRVAPGAGCRLLEPGFASYANAFRVDRAPAGWAAATSDHGGPFVAAVERGAVLGCQFHPELSGRWGASLLARWMEAPCSPPA